MADMLDNVTPTGAMPSASRRRDKPQLSCNLCRKRKLRCDRAQPCETCTRRGLSLSCTYAGSNMSEQRNRVQVHSSMDTGLPERIDQLERLVTSLMTTINNSKLIDRMSPDVHDSPRLESSPLPQYTIKETPPAQNLSQRPNDFGHAETSRTRVVYAKDTDWNAILDGISGFKDSSQGDHHSNENRMATEISANSEEPYNLFGNYDYVNRQEILAAMPVRQVVDRLVAGYFTHRAIAPVVIIHSSTFLNEYERFWEQPAESSIIWVGMLYAVMCLSAAYQQHPALHGPGSQSLIQTYREKIIQCLIIGNYAKGTPYTIETLLLYLQIEYIRNEDAKMETWILLGVIVQLALRKGYHRDPSHIPHISTFHGEMRRRAWAVIVQFDALASAQAGLPRMIKQSHSDTVEPRNLLDEDFSEGMDALPPPRPDTTQTPIQYLLVENKLVNIYGMISDLATSIAPPAYNEVMRLDKILHDASASIPPELHMRPMTKSLMDTPDTIIRRIYLAVLFHKASCILHHQYMVPGKTDRRYMYSRSACIESSMQILEYQVILDQATQSEGRLYHHKWKISSLVKDSFFLATTLLCLDIDYDSKADSLSDNLKLSTDPELRQRMVKVLYNSYSIWVNSSGSSREAQKAVQVIDLVLSKAQNMNEKRLADSNNTANNTMAPNSDSVSTTAGPLNRVAGVPPSPITSTTVSTNTMLLPTSIPLMFNFNANSMIDYSGLPAGHF